MRSMTVCPTSSLLYSMTSEATVFTSRDSVDVLSANRKCGVFDPTEQCSRQKQAVLCGPRAHQVHVVPSAAQRRLSSLNLNHTRMGLSKALNTAARCASRVVNPVDVNGKGILYKFD